MLAVCHVLRYVPWAYKIKEIIDSGEIGEVVNIRHTEPVSTMKFARCLIVTLSLPTLSLHTLSLPTLFLPTLSLPTLSLLTLSLPTLSLRHFLSIATRTVSRLV